MTLVRQLCEGLTIQPCSYIKSQNQLFFGQYNEGTFFTLHANLSKLTIVYLRFSMLSPVLWK